MTDQEMLDNMKLLLNPINNKLEKIDIRIGNLENRMGNLENRMGNLENRMDNLAYENRQEHKDIRQDIGTIVTVLNMKGILPGTQIFTGV